MLNTRLRILHLEDNSSDAELIYIELMNSFPSLEYTIVINKDEFIKALIHASKENTCQIVLADYNVPGIVGLEALELTQKYCPNTPFIFISGGIDLDKGIEILHAGATDYVMKNNIERLPIAIKRALEEIQNKLDKENAESDLIKLNIAIDNSINEVYIFDAVSLKFSYANNGALKNLGYTLEALKTMSPLDIKPKFSFDSFTKTILPLKNGIVDKLQFETIYERKDKTTYPVEVNLTKFTVDNKSQYLKLVIDLTQKKIEEEIRLKAVEITNHFLQESQSIALLGYYTYDYKTTNWSASKSISDLMGLKMGEGNLQDWINFIHPKDKYILTDTLNKRLTDDTATLDLTYRIIPPKDGKIHWIHHKAQSLKRDAKGNLLPTLGVIQDITEQKLAEERLKISEFKLKEAQEITRLGTFSLDDRIGLFETSPILDAILGIDDNYSKDRLVWRDLVHPDDLKGAINLFTKSHIENVSKELRVIRPIDQKIIWVLAILKKEFDSSGRRIRIVGTFQDITERKLNEAKIQQSDTILNQIESLVQVLDKKGNITYTSPSVKKLLGYEPQEMLGQGWWQKTTSSLEAANKTRDAVLNNIMCNTIIPDEIISRKIKTKEGHYKMFQWVSSRGVDNSIIFVGIDITEKQEKEKQYKTLIETAQSAIVLSNHKGLIIECNNAAQQMFGYTKEEILNSPLTLIMPKKYILQHKKGFSEANKNGLKHPKRIVMLEGLTKEGCVFPIEMSYNQWKKNGNYVYCAFINDITERKREEQTKEIIYNITKKASEYKNIENLFGLIREELSQIIDTTNFYIALYNEKTELIDVPYLRDEYDDNKPFYKGNTLTGYVIDTQKSFLATKKEEKKESIVYYGNDSKCWLGVPLIVNKKSIGVMAVQSYTDKKAYAQKDVDLLELIASNISQIIKQSQDFEQINLLNQALMQSPEMVFVTDLKGVIEYVNPAFTKISGYSELEALGQTPRILKSGEQQLSNGYKSLWKTLIKGKTWSGEIINKRKNNTTFLVEANISPVKNKAGIITHYLCIEEDITKKRKLERDFIHAFVDAQEQEKHNFGEELHDGISQILSAQSMYIDVMLRLNKDRLDDKTKFLHNVKELNTNAINDIRAIAHGLMSKQLTEKGLLLAVAQICDDYNQSKTVEFKCVYTGLTEEEISKDIKMQLFRVTQEISTNIIRHSGATKAQVYLSKTKKNQLELVVKDNGVGIDLVKIKKENKGVGLKNIERRITLLNGKMNLDSKPNKGTIYTILVPLN